METCTDIHEHVLKQCDQVVSSHVYTQNYMNENVAVIGNEITSKYNKKAVGLMAELKEEPSNVET